MATATLTWASTLPRRGSTLLGVDTIRGILYYIDWDTFATVYAFDVNAQTDLGEFIPTNSLFRGDGFVIPATGVLCVITFDANTTWEYFDHTGALLNTITNREYHRFTLDNSLERLRIWEDSQSFFTLVNALTPNVTISQFQVSAVAAFSGGPVSNFSGMYFGFSDSCPVLVYPTTLPTPVVYLPPVTPTPILDPMVCVDPSNPSGGGIGNAGCNVGGVGRGLVELDEYAEIPTRTEPLAGEPLTGKDSVDLWIAWHHKGWPSGAITTIRRALVTLDHPADYEGGLKNEALLEIGEFEHGLGNEGGTFEAADITFRMSDEVDRWIRTQLGDQVLEGDEVEFYLASRAAAEAGTPPCVLMRAIIDSVELNAPLLAVVTAVDPLLSVFGPLGGRKDWPFFKLGDLFHDAPSDSAEAPLAPLYGPKTDAGATDPITGEPREKGVIPWRYVRRVRVSGTSEASALLPTSVSDAVGSPTNVGSLGGPANPGWIEGTKPRLIVYRVKDGVMGPGVDNPGATPANPEVISGGVHVWDDTDDGVGVAGYYLDIAVPFDVPSDFHPITNPYPGRGVRYQIVKLDAPHFIVNDASPADDWRFGTFWTGAGDGLSWDDRNAVPNPDGAEWDMYVVCHGACYHGGGGVYGSDLGNGSPENKHDRMRLDLATRLGSDLLWPWNDDGTPAASWPYADPFIDLVADDGETYRLTVGFARGALSDDHKNGVVNITCNMNAGIEDVGDGTGLPIVKFHHAEPHCIENFWLGMYRTGLWCTASNAPKWPDGTYKVRYARFKARQEFTAAKLGDIGLRISWLPDLKPFSSHIAEFNDSSETAIGTNGFSSISIGYIDETEDPADWVTIRHDEDIFGQPRTQTGVSRENANDFYFDWDNDAQKFREGPIPLKNATAIAKYKGRLAKGAGPVQSTMLYRMEDMLFVGNRRLARLGLGLFVLDIHGRIDWWDHDVDGPGVLLHSPDGRGAAGYAGVPCQIRRRRFTSQSKVVTLTLWELQDILLATKFPNGLERIPLVTNTPGEGLAVTNDTNFTPLVL